MGQRSDWDEDVASHLPGKRVLVGLSTFDADGELVEREQVFGRVETVDADVGIRLALEGHREGDAYVLPPDTRAFSRAQPGEYTLKTTGEVVSDPDFLVVYALQQPRIH
jgi:hypothetical protein